MSRAAILFCVGLLIFLIAALFFFVFVGVLFHSALCLLFFLSFCLLFAIVFILLPYVSEKFTRCKVRRMLILEGKVLHLEHSVHYCIFCCFFNLFSPRSVSGDEPMEWTPP